MPTSRLRRRCAPLVATTAALLFAALAGCDAPRTATSTLPLTDCRLPKLATTALCGTLAVPEDRSKPGGRKIDIFVAVLPANSISPKEDPLVILAGGPGQAASQLAPLSLRLNDVRRNRDIVLIDQRGAGRSSPLACEALKPRADVESSFNLDSVPRAKECMAELEARGVDLRQYTTEAWIADIEAVRAALGYPKLNLWGGSYGTRVALAYLRRHPDRVRAIVLDGVAPPGMSVPRDVWPSRERALDAVIAACGATPACRDRHPALAQTLTAIAAELGPGGRTIELLDPRTGAPTTVTMTFDLVLAALHSMTYAPERAALAPEIIARASAGDFAPMIATAQSMAGNLSEQLSIPLHYSVICAEDAPRVGPEDRAKLEGSRSRALAMNVLDVCEFWPRGTPPADAASPVKSDVPALLLSGGLDPVTPPSFAAEVAATLPNGRHVVAAGHGHIVSTQSCVPRLIGSFVERGSAAELSESCIEFLGKTRRSPLWPDALGP